KISSASEPIAPEPGRVAIWTVVDGELCAECIAPRISPVPEDESRGRRMCPLPIQRRAATDLTGEKQQVECHLGFEPYGRRTFASPAAALVAGSMIASDASVTTAMPTSAADIVSDAPPRAIAVPSSTTASIASAAPIHRNSRDRCSASVWG